MSAEGTRPDGRGGGVSGGRDRVADGLRAGIPFGIAAFLAGVSFGVIAQPVMGSVAPIVMSAVVFAGASQFAAVAVIAAGGDAVAAIVAGILLNARFLAMGIALAPSLTGGPARRGLEGQAVVDASWALANRGDGRFDRDLLLGATLAQYPAWLLGTVVGVLGGEAIGDPRDYGLDAVFPAFFLALVWEELGDRVALGVAAISAALALVLVPLTPPGVPVIAACVPAILAARLR